LAGCANIDRSDPAKLGKVRLSDRSNQLDLEFLTASDLETLRSTLPR
jgi:hypothetical protein